LHKSSVLYVLVISCLYVFGAGRPIQAQPLDISDTAVRALLASPFQYDYTTITDDSSLRRFIDALDYQLAAVEYRQRREFTAAYGSPAGRQSFKGELEDRYRELMRDGFIFKKLNEWLPQTADSANRAFIRLFIDRHNEFTADPTMIRKARELSRRLADRLYTFSFEVEGQRYNADEAARIVFADGDIELARSLHRLINDSAAVLARDAANLYAIYKAMGQQRGHRTSQDYVLSRLSFSKPEWMQIADGLKKATDAEFNACLDFLKKETGQDNLAMFEIDRRLIEGAVLPDSCFPPDKIDTALARLLAGLGLEALNEKLTVRVDSTALPALAVRLYPPFDNLLLKCNRGGFLNYRRLAGELGRAMPWVFADTSLPYLLRDYPIGSEEMMTDLFEKLALRPEFLAANFSIAPDDLKRFETYRRWQVVSGIRRVLLYFYFDYYLSNSETTNPDSLYMALEDSLFKTGDSTYQWIEILLTGELETFPEKLANIFTLVKQVEILYTRFGSNFVLKPESGLFMIDKFCLPGRKQTIEEYITAFSPDRISVKDIKRQLQLR